MIDKGIQDYVVKLSRNKWDAWMLHAILYKRQWRALKKFFKQWWAFLMSSRPLDREQYLTDSEDISDEFLPPLMEMGTLYYFKMNGSGDNSTFLGKIKCGDINTIEMITEGNYFTFIIDLGKKKYEFSTTTWA